MIKHNQDGAISGVGLSLGLCLILLVAVSVFGVWSFIGRQDYKNNVNSKVDKAVSDAVAKQLNKDNLSFIEKYKLPYVTYNGPSSYGSINLTYPKTWSGYVNSDGTGSALVDGYFNHGTVPSITAQTSLFDLRLQVLNQTYDQAVMGFTNYQKQGFVSVKAFSLKNVPSVVGIQVIGQLPTGASHKDINMIVLPLRSNTLQVWTEGNNAVSDFNNIILPNLSFSP